MIYLIHHLKEFLKKNVKKYDKITKSKGSKHIECFDFLFSNFRLLPFGAFLGLWIESKVSKY